MQRKGNLTNMPKDEKAITIAKINVLTVKYTELEGNVTKDTCLLLKKETIQCWRVHTVDLGLRGMIRW